MEGGGAERQLTYLAAELRRLGEAVHVAVVSRGANWERLLASGAAVHELRARGAHDPLLLLRLLRLIREVKPDIVQVWLRQMDILGGLAAVALGRPFIVTERSSEGAYPHSLKHAIRIRMARLADAIVSNSEGGERYWRTRVTGRVRHYVVPNAVPIDEIERAEPAHVAMAGSNRPIVLFAGRLEPEKNIDTLLEAVRLALADEDFDFVCCGAGTLRVRVSDWVAQHALGTRARLMGYTPVLWGLMKRAALLVSPSLFEGSPNVVLEGMACRCPLVVSDIPEHRALLDEHSAFIAPAGSAAGLADVIVQALRDGDAARRRADAAYVRVQRFAPAIIARQYRDIYRSVLAGRAGDDSSPGQRTCVES